MAKHKSIISAKAKAKGADGMQPFALDCIAHIVDAEMD